jgi:hypothetical protein
MRTASLAPEELNRLKGSYTANPLTGEIWLKQASGPKVLVWPNDEWGPQPRITVRSGARNTTLSLPRLMWILATGQEPPGNVTTRDGNILNLRADNLCSGPIRCLQTALNQLRDHE